MKARETIYSALSYLFLGMIVGFVLTFGHHQLGGLLAACAN